MDNFSLSDKTFDVINKILVLLITLIIIYPLIFVISASISDPTAAVDAGKMWLWPVDITLAGFKKVFENDAIWLGYRNTIFYTIIGTLIHLIVLLPCAYALSRKELMAKKLILWIILFTMFYSTVE